MYFEYGETEISYLRSKDKRLAEVIDQIGIIKREIDPDLFSSVVHHIIGQQISMKAQATIWQRMKDALGEVNAETILAADIPKTFSSPGGKERYWEQVPLVFCRDRYSVEIRECVESDIIEIDTFRELKAIDKTYDV